MTTTEPLGGGPHPALVDDIGRAILAASGVDGDPLTVVRTAADAELAARDLLRQAVGTARAGGQSWAAIGAVLGMSRQAVQQRFGDRPAVDDDAEPGALAATGDDTGEQRWLGPVTAFDEMPELDLAGRKGWHTISVGMLRHLMVRTPTQWEHKRIIWTGSLKRYEKDGWAVGARALPWVYLVRDTGLPAED